MKKTQMDKNRYKMLMTEAATDERFAKVKENPLFRRVPQKEKRVQIDKRFKSMFKDKKFKLKYHMDARGRPIDTTSNENLKRIYNLASEDEDSDDDTAEGIPAESKPTVKGPSEQKNIDSGEDLSSSDPDGESEEHVENHFEKPDTGQETKTKLTETEKKKLHAEIDYARGEGRFLSEESSSDSSDTEEEEEDMHEWGEMDKDAERTEESTHRLALCNMDWDRVSAADLMVLFNSFVPQGGVLQSIAIYTSEFGKKRLAEEEIHGPKELVGDHLDSDEDDDADAFDENEEGSSYDMEKLRKYQLTRLKYYYAVLVFNSVEAADKVYTECDNMEYESSATRIDLRFIPDDTTFDDEPKDICEKLPEVDKYRPRFFTTKALQQMKVDLTWDETDQRRKELTERLFNKKENVDDADIRAYLATSSESEDEDDKANEEEGSQDNESNDPIMKYKALLQSIEDTEKKKKDKDVELEITWGVGLKQKSEELVKKKIEEQSTRTPWEEMLAKRREKRKNQKAQRKEEESQKSSAEESTTDSSDSDEEVTGTEEQQMFSDDDVDVDLSDPYFQEELKSNEVFQRSKKQPSKKDAIQPKSKQRETQKTDAELELLLLDEEKDNKHHFSLKKIMEAESNSTSKRKKHKRKGKDAAVSTDDFQIDLQDDRFSALYSSHHFNLDPSDPSYKKTKAMEALVGEKQKRRMQNDTKSAEPTREQQINEEDRYPEISTAKKAKSELDYLIKSVKGKAANLKHPKKYAVHPHRKK